MVVDDLEDESVLALDEFHFTDHSNRPCRLENIDSIPGTSRCHVASTPRFDTHSRSHSLAQRCSVRVSCPPSRRPSTLADAIVNPFECSSGASNTPLLLRSGCLEAKAVLDDGCGID